MLTRKVSEKKITPPEYRITFDIQLSLGKALACKGNAGNGPLDSQSIGVLVTEEKANGSPQDTCLRVPFFCLLDAAEIGD